MATYTVHVRQGAPGGEPDVHLVRDGFALWAFVFGPLWLLVRGLWIALALYVAASVILAVAFATAGLNEVAETAIALGLGVLVGFHARDVQRWTLARRGYRLVGLVDARDQDAALGRALAANLLPARLAPSLSVTGLHR